MIKFKDQTYFVLQYLIEYVETQFDSKIKVIRSDNGGEFVNEKCLQLFVSKGTIHQTICPYTPQ